MSDAHFRGDGTKLVWFDPEFTEEIVVESDVFETVAANACYQCNCTSIDLTRTTIRRIETHAFNTSYSLQTIKLPDTIVTILSAAIHRCGITSFYVGPKVKSFTGRSLSQNPNLNTLEVDPQNEYFVSSNNFIFDKNKTKLIRTPVVFDQYSIPFRDTVEVLSDQCMSIARISSFFGWKSIKNISVMVFHATNWIKYIDLSMTQITQIPREAFRLCHSLKTIKLPETLEIIDEKAFILLNGLESINIPHSVTSISNSAFSNLNNLKEINYFGNISFSSNELFDNCSNIREIHVTNLYLASTFANFPVKNDAYQMMLKTPLFSICNQMNYCYTYTFIYSVLVYL